MHIVRLSQMMRTKRHPVHEINTFTCANVVINCR